MTSTALETAYIRLGIEVLPNGQVKFGKGKDVRILVGRSRNAKGSTGKLLKGYNIPKFNLKTIYEFDLDQKVRGRALTTRAHYLYVLAKLGERIRVPFAETTENHLKEFVGWIEDNKEINHTTKQNYKVYVLTFFRRLLKTKDIPPQLNFLEIKPRLKKVHSQDLLTKEEVLMMINSCENPRDKAVISTLYETSIRAGEIISCRIKHLQIFPEGWGILTIPSENPAAVSGKAKTGQHECEIIQSIPYLKEHLNNHPNRTDGESPLFHSRNQYMRGALEYQGVLHLVKRAAKRAGIKKPVYPHLLRHSISTEWAKQGYTAEEINIRSGRSQGSRIAQVYINLTGGDVRKKILARAGIIPEDEHDKTLSLGHIKCWACGKDNPSRNIICSNKECNLPLIIKKEDRKRFERVSDALFTYKTIEKAAEFDPKLITGMLEGVLRSLKERESNDSSSPSQSSS